MKQYSYLALGDSYTIGEQVPLYESFPYQTVQLLRRKFSTAASMLKSMVEPVTGTGYFLAPEIIAVTGFTTDELNVAIDNTALLPQYDRVSLLIGVNNQYRGRSAEDFSTGFDRLLKRAVQLAGNIPRHVFVLSIPDWGVTPFATGRDREKIASEIDAFNKVCQTVSAYQQVHFIDITTSQRTDGGKDDFLAVDQLHPSGKEYAKWAALLANQIIMTL